MIAADYDSIAVRYHEVYGEPLVADFAWVEPLFEACSVAVEGDPTLDPYHDFYAEAVIRTADTIAVMTHGLGHVVTRHR